jgi:hypothetical protein
MGPGGQAADPANEGKCWGSVADLKDRLKPLKEELANP